MMPYPRSLSANDGLRPVVRWAGSKRRLARLLVPHLDLQGGSYFEPFAGSASLFFALQPSRAILCDLNEDLINAYRHLKADPILIWLAVAAIRKSSSAYYDWRDCDTSRLSPFYRAVRFVYLNRYAFNGIYRTNRRGEFNVPVGKRTGGLPSPEAFVAVARLLNGATLVAGDFASALETAKAGDIAYLDPPYHSPTRAAHGEYGYNIFGLKDMGRLIAVVRELDRRGVRVMISYRSRRPFQDELESWHFRRVPVRRQVSASVVARRTTSEILITNWRLPSLRGLRT